MKTVPSLMYAILLLLTMLIAGGCVTSKPPASPKAFQNGSATIRGMAGIGFLSKEKKPQSFLCTGRSVYLIPATPESTDWIRNVESRQRGEPTDYEWKMFSSNPYRELPDFIRQESAVAIGFGKGSFEFKGISDGEYHVLFWLNTTGVSQRVTVHDGVAIPGLLVLSNERKAP